MKRFYLFTLCLLIGLSCQSPKEQDSASIKNSIPGAYGEKISSSEAMTVEEMFGRLEQTGEFSGQVTADIQEVCTKKGCWLTVALPDGALMRVTFKDYGFFVPTDSKGHPIVLDGKAQKTVTDVETLRHYAEDAGKPQEEIDAITAPKEEYTFEATGVIIKDKV